MSDETFSEKFKEVLFHPISFLFGLLYLAQFLLGTFDPIFNFLASTSGIWYPIVTVSASEIVPRLEFVPDGWGDYLIILGSILFVVSLLDQFGERVYKKFFESTRKAGKKVREGMRKKKNKK